MTRAAGLVAALGAATLPCRATVRRARRVNSRISRPSPTRCSRIPTPADWLDVAAHARQLGLQPARPDQPAQRRAAQARVDAAARAGRPGRHAARPRRHHVLPEPDRHHAGVRRRDRRVRSGSTAARCPRTSASTSRPPRTNRNLAIYDNLIIDNGADGFVYALDARTGKLVWETQILDYKHGAKNSSGPIVADGKVISGRSCEPEGGPEACVITAFDAKTGKEVWRKRTIPKPGEPGDETWGDIPYEKRWHVGTWMVPSYDPELNRVYVGTSVTAPAPKFMLARQRQAVPLSQLDARARRRRPARSSGTTSTSSIIGTSIIRSSACSSTPRVAPDPRRGEVDQSARAQRRAAQGDHGHPRQDGPRLHARSRDGRVPLGARDDACRT